MNQPLPPALQLFGGDGEEAARSGRQDLLILAGGALASLAIFWLTTHNLILVGSAAASMVAAWAVVDHFRRSVPKAASTDMLPPDWSITHAAAELSQAAIAISDRAGRLVCANANFNKAFPGLRAPPDIGTNEAGRELLVNAGRAAWRDGHASVDAFVEESVHYSVRVARAGTADEYLLWRLAPIERFDVERRAAELVTSQIGRSMAQSGVMAVCIGSEGRIRTTNAAFALRATGGETENLTGKEFASYLRLDDKGAIYFEREGRRGLPVRLVHVPLGEEGKEGASLLLLLDEDGSRVERGAALSHVEALLATLPLGLALVERDGRFLFANEAFARVVGLSADELPPYPGDLVIAEDKAAVADTIRRYASGQPLASDIAVRFKDSPDEVIALVDCGRARAWRCGGADRAQGQ